VEILLIYRKLVVQAIKGVLHLKPSENFQAVFGRDVLTQF